MLALPHLPNPTIACMEQAIDPSLRTTNLRSNHGWMPSAKCRSVPPTRRNAQYKNHQSLLTRGPTIPLAEGRSEFRH
jgi:hypothetical protein